MKSKAYLNTKYFCSTFHNLIEWLLSVTLEVIISYDNVNRMTYFSGSKGTWQNLCALKNFIEFLITAFPNSMKIYFIEVYHAFSIAQYKLSIVNCQFMLLYGKHPSIYIKTNCYIFNKKLKIYVCHFMDFNLTQSLSFLLTIILFCLCFEILYMYLIYH